MAYTYDEQLIDAVAVRRRRLTGALLHGPERLRHQFSDRVGTFALGAGLGVLIAAGCVAVSFVRDLLAGGL
ncbi:MAG: hypothetical protein WA962_03330 [Ornithinimicrobium sp.]